MAKRIYLKPKKRPKNFSGGIFYAVLRRLPWLILLLFLGFFVSAAVGIFEGVVSRAALIVSFQSLVLGMAGNVGTQSLSLTIRALATARSPRHPILSELAASSVLGILLGFLSFFSVGAYTIIFKEENPRLCLALALCVGAAMMLSITVAGLMGALVPRMLLKLGADPAVASGPIITTVNDLFAVLIYYGAASLLILQVFS